MTKAKNVSLTLAAGVFVFALATLVLSFPVLAKSENAGNSKEKNISANASSSVSSSATSSKGQVKAQEKQSPVANFVQTLLKTADREKGGIGEQVRAIAQQQNDAEATTTAIINKIEARGKIKTFLIGSDYKNLGALRKQVVQTRNNLSQLTRLMEQTKNATSTAEMQSQIQALEQEQVKIESFIKAQEGKFSLFGWIVKIFQ